MVAGQHKLARLAPTDKPRQHRRLHAGRDAVSGLRHAELRVVGRRPHVAAGGDLHTRAETIAVDARDHRYRELAHGIADPVRPGRGVLRLGKVEFGHLRDVGPSDEGPVAGAGQHDGA